MNRELVLQYYASFHEDEWNRLTWPEGVVEFAVTTHALSKYLPPAGRVLDIGGGPGRYSIWLAQRGYRVVLADLSPDLLDIARAKISETDLVPNIEAVVTCDACDLTRFQDDSFEAVLSLGPFYHLTDAADREQAARELSRVLKPNGIAFVAFIPIYTFLRRTLALKDERHHLAQPEFLSRLMNEGIFFNDVPGRFNAGYGVRPHEVAPLMERHGLRTLQLLADTSFTAAQAQHLAELAESDPHTYATVMHIVTGSASDPSLLGTSTHLLYIGRKAARTSGSPTTR